MYHIVKTTNTKSYIIDSTDTIEAAENVIKKLVSGKEHCTFSGIRRTYTTDSSTVIYDIKDTLECEDPTMIGHQYYTDFVTNLKLTGGLNSRRNSQ